MGLDKFEIDKKIFSHKKHLLKLLDGEIVYPINIEVDPSNVCNEKCIWCVWEEHRKDKTKMDQSLLEKIVQDLAKVGVKSINWTGGGEPLINKYTPGGIKLAKSLGMQNGIFTNGISIDSSIAETLVENCEWVRVSLGAATPETFYKCHGIKKLTNVLENMELLKYSKDKLKSTATLGWSMLVVKENFTELFQAATYAKERGLNYFQGKPNIIRGSEDFNWWENEVMPLFEKAKRELEDKDFKVLISQYTQDKYGVEGIRFRDSIKNSLEISEAERSKCYVHNFVTAITANGDVAFCKNLRDEKKYLVGNIKDSSFEEIWNGKRKKEIEEEINKNGCGVFCQNGKLNNTLRYIKSLKREDAIQYINSIKPLEKEMHPNFL